MSLLTILEIVGAILLGVALVYGAVQWSSRRGRRIDAMRQIAPRNLDREDAKDEGLQHDLVPDGVPAQAQMADRSPTPRIPTQSLPNPKIAGKLRSGRQGDRPSEDDIVRQHMGPRGLPGEPTRVNTLRESETQIPKALDPGHTA
jgi:hypothetical protein